MKVIEPQMTDVICVGVGTDYEDSGEGYVVFDWMFYLQPDQTILILLYRYTSQPTPFSAYLRASERIERLAVANLGNKYRGEDFSWSWNEYKKTAVAEILPHDLMALMKRTRKNGNFKFLSPQKL